MTKKNRKIKNFYQRIFSKSSELISENEQLQYLPQSVKLEEAVNPHIIKSIMLLISLVIAVFIFWASNTEVKEVAKASGEVVPKKFIQVVQHLEGGVVSNIFVRNGDLVQKGQKLLSIDGNGISHDLTKLKIKQYYLMIEAERLRSFLKDEKPDFDQFEKELNEELENSANTEDIEENKKEINELYVRAQKLKENYEIAKQVLEMHQKLFKKGHLSKLKLLQAQQNVAEIESSAYQELNQLELQIAENNEMLTKLERKVEKLQIRSPVHGLVKGFEFKTIGSIIDSGVTIMEIVPLDKNLLIEAKINPKDIGHLKVGQNVLVKISAYDFARYGAVPGKLEFISATTYIDNNNNPYYRSKIVLSKNYVGNNPDKNIILPGMLVEADIVTGSKTIIAYLLKPIHLSLKTALQER